jgi:hypothetical protein
VAWINIISLWLPPSLAAELLVMGDFRPGGDGLPLQKNPGPRNFFLARRRDSWQRAFSLRVNKFIFNPADDGQENLGRQRNGGGQFDRLPIRCHFCRLRNRLET